MARIFVFDDATGGHHPDFLEGVCLAALGQGHELLVGATHMPDGLRGRDAVQHVPVSSFSLRQPLRGRSELARLMTVAAQRGTDVFLDLFLDKNIWATTVPRRRSPLRRIHILHVITQYRFAGRTRSGRARTVYLRHHLKKLTEHGARVVVHTEHSAKVLTEFVADVAVDVIGLPVGSQNDLVNRVSAPQLHDVPVLLFVGAARPEKGLETLLEAATDVGTDVVVAVVGSQPDRTREKLTEQFPRVSVEWSDRFLSRSELDAAYAASTLVVLPYRPSYDTGAASMVMWETLSYGRPLVTSDSLADQLPSGYEGAIVSEASGPALANCLREALSILPQLQKSAQNQGPRIIKSDHTYEHYVAAALEHL